MVRCKGTLTRILKISQSFSLGIAASPYTSLWEAPHLSYLHLPAFSDKSFSFFLAHDICASLCFSPPHPQQILRIEVIWSLGSINCFESKLCLTTKKNNFSRFFLVEHYFQRRVLETHVFLVSAVTNEYLPSLKLHRSRNLLIQEIK